MHDPLASARAGLPRLASGLFGGEESSQSFAQSHSLATSGHSCLSHLSLSLSLCCVACPCLPALSLSPFPLSLALAFDEIELETSPDHFPPARIPSLVCLLLLVPFPPCRTL